MKKLYLSVITCAIISLSLAQNNSNFHLKLRAVIGNGNYHTDFYFNDNCSSGIDSGYDAAVFNYTAPATAIYSNLANGSYSNIDFAIQSLHTSALGSDIIVPLGVNVSQGQNVTIKIAETSLPSNIGVLLDDTVTGISTLLNYNDYNFTPSITLNGSDRFNLRFTSQTLSNPDAVTKELNIYYASTTKSLFIKGQLTDHANIALYDMSGRLVHASKLETASTGSSQINVSHLQSGVYVIKLNNGTQQKNQRVIIK